MSQTLLTTTMRASLAFLSLFSIAPAQAAEMRPLLITVDDLPVAGRGGAGTAAEKRALTERLLAVLAKHHVKAVGFVIWGQVTSDDDRKLLESWLAAGHELGSHSFSHPNLSTSSLADYLADLEKGRDGLGSFLQAHGRTLRYFRYPYLNEGETLDKLRGVRAWLAAHALTNIPVTIDTQDWSFDPVWRDAKSDAERDDVREQYRLAMHLSTQFHERHGDALFGRTTPQTLLVHANLIGAEEWDALLGWFEQHGHRIVGPDELLRDPVFAEPHEFTLPQGGSLWDRIANQRDKERAEREVRQLLVEQSAAWSRGDVDSFCSVYAEDTLFVSPSGITRGRQPVIDRYKKRYPSAKEMGTLSLDVDTLTPIYGPEVSLLDDSVPGRVHAVSVIARWKLERVGMENAEGWTSLLIEKRQGRWWITRDASF